MRERYAVENMISAAMEAVQDLQTDEGAMDPKLTAAMDLLSCAQGLVGEWADGRPAPVPPWERA